MHEDSRIVAARLADQVPVPPPAPPAPPPSQGLFQQHVEGALLYADRHEMVRRLNLPKGAAIAEIGVALGEFSEFLLAELQPTIFHGIDLFRMHESPVIWGKPSTELFDNMTQLDFYKRRFASEGDRVKIGVGLSYDVLETLDDASLDMIYIDAGHDYDDVKRDAEVAVRKIKPNGTLIFNDYVMNDGQAPYGVVQAVNELVLNSDWKVIGLALQRHMFCDIALRRG